MTAPSSRPDRYISYKGIDCMAQADAVVDRGLAATADPAVTNELAWGSRI